MKYRHILLIDDDEDDRELFALALKEVAGDADYTILESADIALTVLADKSISPDIIFLDLNMPRVSGLDFLKEAKEIDSLQGIPIIIYSTCTFQEIEIAQLAGATSFIIKPDSFKELKKALQKILL